MNQRRSGPDDLLADVVCGLVQTKGAAGATVAGQVFVIPAQLAYLQIPAAELRHFVDGIFPNLASSSIADTAAGLGHRYRAGHDLVLDVPATFSSHGPSAGIDHLLHIVFTDFPTKAGIPVPGFSQTGLGQLVEQAGISNGWLQLSLFDTGVGILAISDGASALAKALQGSLHMGFGTACQTFGVGSVEIGLAVTTQNPLLLTGGVENVLAGVVSTWKTFSVYVDPIAFLGAAGTSALLGFGISYGLMGNSLSGATLDAVRGGTIGALFSVSSAFGFGALAGFAVYRYGVALARNHDGAGQDRLVVDENSCRMLVRELSAGNTDLADILRRTASEQNEAVHNPFADMDSSLFSGSARTLAMDAGTLQESGQTLNSDAQVFAVSYHRLSDDPPSLLSIYNSAIKRAGQFS